MSRERRIELFNRLIDAGLSEAEEAELDRLQRSTRARIEPPINIKNEIRMAELDGRHDEEDAK